MAKESKSLLAGLGEFWGGLSVQSRLVVVLVVGLVGSAFFSGYLFGQVRLLKGGVVAGSATGGSGTVAGANGTGDGSAPQATPSPGPLSEALWKEVVAKPAAVKGNGDAKVTIVEFTDYQCPFCGRHFEQTDPQIQESYVETGKVKYVIRDLPLPFHGNAQAAAEAARCAGDQGKYWEMHDKLFEGQQEWSTGDPESTFSAYAGEVGVGVSGFDQCLSSGKYKEAVAADLALASEVGATGTPTFFVNGKILVGAQPFSAFESVIEAEL